MIVSKLMALAAAAAMLAACEARVGENAGTGNASAEGRAEEGRLTIDAPGMELKVSIPEGLRGSRDLDENSGLIYPGATFSGIHVSGGRGGADGEVEIAFASPDSPDRVAAWYRDPARAADFTIGSTEQDGRAQVIAGTTREDGNDFRLRLSPDEGGTRARLLIRDRH